jgi:ApaG protein
MQKPHPYAIEVRVKTAYLEDQSSPDEFRFAFSYTVTMTNVGEVAAQLISRHWIISDADGKISEVKGLGVVGAQPLLQPQEKFEYTSGTVLNTSNGEMRGSYFFVAVDGTQFEAEIPLFILTQPRVLH